jgi:hypothetical protein
MQRTHPRILRFTYRYTTSLKNHPHIGVTVLTGEWEYPPQTTANEDEVAESGLRQPQNAIASGYRGNAFACLT